MRYFVLQHYVNCCAAAFYFTCCYVWEMQKDPSCPKNPSSLFHWVSWSRSIFLPEERRFFHQGWVQLQKLAILAFLEVKTNQNTKYKQFDMYMRLGFLSYVISKLNVFILKPLRTTHQLEGCRIAGQGRRTSLPKFKFSAKFPICLHMILHLLIN